MNGLTQGKIALIIALTVLFSQWVGMVYIYYAIGAFQKYLFILPLLASLLVYFLILALIEYFILRKVKILYRTIGGIGRKIDKPSLKDPELFENLRTQVEIFQKEKTTEIEVLKENEKFRREFIGNVSHELKTPLTSIQGFVEILLEEAQSGKPAEVKYLQKIANNSDRLIDIVQDLTMISQAESNELILNLEKFHIYELVLTVMDSLEEMAKEKRTIIEVKDLNHISYQVYADKQKIYQVLYNLIENAIFYCPPQSKIAIRFFDLESNIMVEVADNGEGITLEHLPRIFERFYRVDPNRSRAKGGSGLGLSIVKKIIEAHGYTIQVDSQVNKGTRFRFGLKKG
ncbi:MAG: GHKL domain-containing protein [Chitinophagales bacterium]|nr:GHKL domain-containing protein [Chitinophagales bacterium]